MHRKGSHHANADGLSRKPARKCKCKTCKECHESCESAKTQVLCPVVTRQQTQNSSWMEQWSQEDMIKWQKQDPNLVKIITWLNSKPEKPPWPDVQTQSKETKTLWYQWDMLILKDGILYRKNPKIKSSGNLQLVAPGELRKMILKHLHDGPTASHVGSNRTYGSVKQRFYWPHMKQDVLTWCSNCACCAQRKRGIGISKAPLHQVPVGDRCERVSLDIIGPLPETGKHNIYILTIVDHFTKFAEAYPLMDQTAITVADSFAVNWISHYGVPDQIHCDQGRQFESNLLKSLCDLLKISKSKTTPYRPQSDGLTERLNRTIQDLLSIVVNEERNDWDDHLPFIMMAYRATPQASTGISPNKMFFGSEISLPIDCMYKLPLTDTHPIECPHEYVLWLQAAMSQAHAHARVSLKKCAARQKHSYNKGIKLLSFLWSLHDPQKNK